jgi:poly(hydroxyalkanoate) granule-associated protein
MDAKHAWENATMAAKLKKKSAAAKVEAVAIDESALKAIGKKIMEIPEQIWQAGLGAFQKAQEQGGKMFETLVKEGSALEAATTKFTTKRVQDVRGAVESTMNTVKDRAADTWDRLEKVFEDRVSKALGALGIPGRRDLEDLTRQVAELQKAISDLKKSSVKAVETAVVSKTEQVVKAVKAAPAKAVKAVKAAPEQARKVVAKAKKVATDMADKAAETVKDLTK